MFKSQKLLKTLLLNYSNAIQKKELALNKLLVTLLSSLLPYQIHPVQP